MSTASERVSHRRQQAEAAASEAKKAKLVELLNSTHHYLTRSFDKSRYVYFSQSGCMRASMIHGYILGLMHSGVPAMEEMAAEMLSQFTAAVDRLTNSRDSDIQVEGETLKIPTTKAVVHDDGTWHGFSIVWLRAVNPEVFQAEYEKRVAADPDTRTYVHMADTKQHFKVQEDTDKQQHITETRFLPNGKRIDIYYTRSHNGGLIYHGPGAGDTFTVSLDRSSNFWGIHT